MRPTHWLGLTILLSGLVVACGDRDMNNGPGTSGAGAGSSGSGASSGTAGAGATTTPQDGSVVINEIMVNPAAVSDDTGEWIELYNPGGQPVDIEGWTLKDAGNNSHVIASSTVIEPGAYAVIGRSGDADKNGGVTVAYHYGEDFALANSGDTVTLDNAGGEEIDSVTYGADGWPMDTPGVSLELESEGFDNSAAGNWMHAVMPFGAGDLGTPGAPNGGDLPTFAIDESVISWHNPDLRTSVHFAPLDDVESHVLAELEKATTSIKLAFFNVRLDQVKELLVQKIAAGVDVQVVLDKKQQDKSYNTMGEEMIAAGIPVTLVNNTGATDATMHNKFAIVDSHLVMTGSANYSYTALHVSDEDMITIDDAALAARFELELDEIIAGGDVSSAPYAGNEAIKAYMGPEDGLSYKVRDMLDAAQSTAVVAMFQLNAQLIVDALISAHQRGVSVVVVLDDVQASQTGADADEQLSAAGVSVILAHNTGNMVAEMHSKFVVCDHQTVLMGSYNWTNLGSFFNDENVIVLDDAHMAARFEGRVADLLNDYNAPSPATMGLTTGMQTVTFEVGNVTLDPGVSLYIVGGPFASGVELTGGALTTTIETGTGFDYHYEIRHEGSTVAGETIEHGFTVPYAPGPFTVRDAFVN